MSDLDFGYSHNFRYKLKKEMSSLLINKTPISLLQEWLSHLGKKPNYELLQEGIGVNSYNTHSFCFRVSIGEISAIGYGKSKKEAKHNAARSLLTMLIDGGFVKRQTNFNEIGKLEGKNCLPWNQFQRNIERSPEVEIYNPVGKLQEICTARRWAHPVYMLVSEQGPPHDRVFTISVEVQNIKLIGEGKSKRLAKRQAALKMMKRLLKMNEEEDSEARCDLVQTGEVYINYAQILQEIATRQNFDICYEKIKDKTPEGLYQCILRIITRPVIVCRGQGSTSEKAINNAAMHTLDCLNIMFRKKFSNNLFLCKHPHQG